jgi:pentose-5-phosphate-3-epimerase/putative flippase GtrA
VIFDKNFLKHIDYFLYRRIHLFLYIIFGIISVTVELLLRDALINLKFSIYISNYVGVFSGIFLMFFLNSKFNFQIPKHLFLKSFIYFFVISILSNLLQNFFNLNHTTLFEFSNFTYFENDYNFNKIIYMIFFFICAYIIHRNISFKDEKKVGIAIYANGHEDIELIYNKIGQYPDFIHVDIVDNSIKKNAPSIQSYKLEVIKAYWPNHKIETHIMSKNPSAIIPLVAKYSDVVYFHWENQENDNELVDKIVSYNCRPGLAIHYKSEISISNNYFKDFKDILLLSIDEIGRSGQVFNTAAYKKIEILNKIEKNNNFSLCVDGGINLNNINNINSKKVISGSNVLNNSNPKKQIMKLKTVARYAK